jgi:hypothetical protein
VRRFVDLWLLPVSILTRYKTAWLLAIIVLVAVVDIRKFKSCIIYLVELIRAKTRLWSESEISVTGSFCVGFMNLIWNHAAPLPLSPFYIKRLNEHWKLYVLLLAHVATFIGLPQPLAYLIR